MNQSRLPEPGQEYRALIFDWDGTVANTEAVNYAALATVLRSVGVPITREWFAERTGISSTELIRSVLDSRAIADVGVSPPVEQRDRLFFEGLGEVTAFPDTLAVIEAEHGRRPLAVASGGSGRAVRAGIDSLGLADRFNAVVTRDEVNAGKPAPDAYLLAAELLAVRPEDCLVYEDTEEGIAAARAAGMDVLDVRTARATGQR